MSHERNHYAQKSIIFLSFVHWANIIIIICFYIYRYKYFIIHAMLKARMITCSLMHAYAHRQKKLKIGQMHSQNHIGPLIGHESKFRLDTN